MKESTKQNISIVSGILVSSITGILCLKKLPSDKDIDYSKTFSSFKNTTDNIKNFSLAFVVESISVSLATVAGIAGFWVTKKVLDRINGSSSDANSCPPELRENGASLSNWSLKIDDRRRLEKQSKIDRSPKM